jgi:hypothetical protein
MLKCTLFKLEKQSIETFEDWSHFLFVRFAYKLIYINKDYLMSLRKPLFIPLSAFIVSITLAVPSFAGTKIVNDDLMASPDEYTTLHSKVTTPKGTFACENSCVVDGDGNVSDCCGGEVWKKQADSIDG